MTNIAKATPRPWRIHLVDNTMIVGTDGAPAAFVRGDYVDDTQWPMMEANAALIVRAVNSHADLVAALEAALPRLESCAATYNEHNFTDRHREGPLLTEAVRVVRAALAKARG